MTIVNKINMAALAIGLIGTLLSGVSPLFGYIGTISFCICYSLSLVKEGIVNKKVSVLSVLLCLSAVLWLVLGRFFNFKYAPIFGIIVIYGYILNSVYRITGKITKDIIALSVLLLISKIVSITFPEYRITKIFSIITMVVLLYRLLYPIVYKAFLFYSKRIKAKEQKTEENQ